MHDDKTLSNIRNLNDFFGILPGEPSCDSYPTRGMSLTNIHETYHRREQTRIPNSGRVIGVLKYDLKTREMTIIASADYKTNK